MKKYVKKFTAKLLQDLEEPPDEWIKQKDRSGRTFYTNPATGSNNVRLVAASYLALNRG